MDSQQELTGNPSNSTEPSSEKSLPTTTPPKLQQPPRQKRSSSVPEQPDEHLGQIAALEQKLDNALAYNTQLQSRLERLEKQTSPADLAEIVRLQLGQQVAGVDTILDKYEQATAKGNRLQDDLTRLEGHLQTVESQKSQAHPEIRSSLTSLQNKAYYFESEIRCLKEEVRRETPSEIHTLLFLLLKNFKEDLASFIEKLEGTNTDSALPSDKIKSLQDSMSSLKESFENYASSLSSVITNAQRFCELYEALKNNEIMIALLAQLNHLKNLLQFKCHVWENKQRDISSQSIDTLNKAISDLRSLSEDTITAIDNANERLAQWVEQRLLLIETARVGRLEAVEGAIKSFQAQAGKLEAILQTIQEDRKNEIANEEALRTAYFESVKEEISKLQEERARQIEQTVDARLASVGEELDKLRGQLERVQEAHPNQDSLASDRLDGIVTSLNALQGRVKNLVDDNKLEKHTQALENRLGAALEERMQELEAQQGRKEESVVEPGPTKIDGMSNFRQAVGLKHEARFKHVLLAKLPPGFALGKTYNDSGCFFDAIARILNRFGRYSEMTEKALRLSCHTFYSENKELVDQWNANDFSGDDNFDLLERYWKVQYTADECNRLFNGDVPVWGRPWVEGKILCYQGVIGGICVIEIINDPIAGGPTIGFYLATGEGYQGINEQEAKQYMNKGIPTLVVEEHSLHFVPLYSPANQKADERAVVRTPLVADTASSSESAGSLQLPLQRQRGDTVGSYLSAKGQPSIGLSHPSPGSSPPTTVHNSKSDQLSSPIWFDQPTILQWLLQWLKRTSEERPETRNRSGTLITMLSFSPSLESGPPKIKRTKSASSLKGANGKNRMTRDALINLIYSLFHSLKQANPWVLSLTYKTVSLLEERNPEFWQRTSHWGLQNFGSMMGKRFFKDLIRSSIIEAATLKWQDKASQAIIQSALENDKVKAAIDGAVNQILSSISVNTLQHNIQADIFRSILQGCFQPVEEKIKKEAKKEAKKEKLEFNQPNDFSVDDLLKDKSISDLFNRDLDVAPKQALLNALYSRSVERFVERGYVGGVEKFYFEDARFDGTRLAGLEYCLAMVPYLPYATNISLFSEHMINNMQQTFYKVFFSKLTQEVNRSFGGASLPQPFEFPLRLVNLYLNLRLMAALVNYHKQLGGQVWRSISLPTYCMDDAGNRLTRRLTARIRENTASFQWEDVNSVSELYLRLDMAIAAYNEKLKIADQDALTDADVADYILRLATNGSTPVLRATGVAPSEVHEFNKVAFLTAQIMFEWAGFLAPWLPLLSAALMVLAKGGAITLRDMFHDPLKEYKGRGGLFLPSFWGKGSPDRAVKAIRLFDQIVFGTLAAQYCDEEELRESPQQKNYVHGIYAMLKNVAESPSDKMADCLEIADRQSAVIKKCLGNSHLFFEDSRSRDHLPEDVRLDAILTELGKKFSPFQR